MYKERKVMTVRELEIYLIIVIVIFQTPIQSLIPKLQYFDEFIAILMGLFFILNILKFRLSFSKFEVFCILASISMIVVGVVGNFTNNIQCEFKPIIMDIGNNFKFLLVFFGAMLYMQNLKYKNYLIHCLAKTIRIIVSIASIFAVVNFFMDINMSFDIRYGIRSFQFIYGHAGMFNIACYTYLMILTADLFINDMSKGKKYFFIGLNIFIWCCTLRIQAIILALCYMIFIFLVEKKVQFKFKMKYLVMIIPIIILCIVIARPQVEYYFNNSTSPRATLLSYGLQTLITYAPIGAGFATYGSFAAAAYYSRLYYKYGFNKQYGINLNDRRYLMDNYWPSIFGQFGMIGTILMIFILISLVIIIIQRTKGNQYFRLGALLGLFSLLLASSVTASFTHYSAVGIFFIIPLLFTAKTSKGDA